jgi:hypothetical protein
VQRIRAKPRKDSSAYRHQDQTGMPRNGRAMKLGKMETIADLEDTARILARGLAQLGDYVGALRAAALLASMKFRAKELELKGLNLGEGQEFKFTAEDYADRFQSEQAKNAQQAKEIEALKAQIAAMGGEDRPRPRPPRPALN